MARTGEFRITTKLITNPHRDKRRRYGADALENIPEGTGFVYYPPVAKDGWIEPARAVGGFPYGLRPEMIEEMWQCSVPGNPRTAREIALVADGTSALDWVLIDALEAMLADGVVSRETLETYITKVLKEAQ